MATAAPQRYAPGSGGLARPPEKRYNSGKWEGYSQGESDLLCHRVSLVSAGFDRDAGEVVEDVLKRRDTGGYWGRPMFSAPKRFDRFRMVSADE